MSRENFLSNFLSSIWPYESLALVAALLWSERGVTLGSNRPTFHIDVTRTLLQVELCLFISMYLLAL